MTFNDVLFRYRPDGPEILKKVSLDVPQGQVVGIVGPSGSGKSTLTKLVQRLYIPESGQVGIDGVDLTLVDPAWLRRQIGVVLQEPFLYSKTIEQVVDPLHADVMSMHCVSGVRSLPAPVVFE